MQIKSSYKQLQPEQRVIWARLKQQNFTFTRCGQVAWTHAQYDHHRIQAQHLQNEYASRPADQRCKQLRIDGRPSAKLHTDSILYGVVCHFLSWDWAPQQIALQLAASCRKGHKDRVSTGHHLQLHLRTTRGRVATRTHRLFAPS